MSHDTPERKLEYLVKGETCFCIPEGLWSKTWQSMSLISQTCTSSVHKWCQSKETTKQKLLLPTQYQAKPFPNDFMFNLLQL